MCTVNLERLSVCRSWCWGGGVEFVGAKKSPYDADVKMMVVMRIRMKLMMIIMILICCVYIYIYYVFK